MLTNSLSSALPGFSVDFWQPYASAIGAEGCTEVADQAQTPSISYSQPLDGSHDDFCQSEKFQQYKEQVRASLVFLAHFCRQHGMPEVENIKRDFDIFFGHRFDEYHYFDKRAEIVDSVGKQSLDAFCLLIRNEAIDAEKKKNAILNLSQGVTLCADGAVSNLVSAACTLAKSVGGIRGKIWEFKEVIANNVLRQAVEEEFKFAENYRGDEIHYVNTAWDMLADQFGWKKTPDRISMPEVKNDTFLADCAVQVSTALTPDRVSLLIAEACHAQFNSQITTKANPSSGKWNPAVEDRFLEKLEELGNDFGLTTKDELYFSGEERTPVIRKSDLRINSFVKLEQNDDSYTFALRTDPSLIALDVLRAMDDLKLLMASNHPENYGEWIDKEGMLTAFFAYGELAWVARTPRSENFGNPVWKSKNVEFELLTLPDLLQWKARCDNDGRLPPAATVRRLIDSADADQLMKMPAQWLQDLESLPQLLHRLGTDKTDDYLSTNLLYLRSLGANSSKWECKQILSRLMRMGMYDAVRTLAEQWFPATSTRIDMIYAVLRSEAIPALHQALLQPDANTAVSAWCRPLRESGLLTVVAPRLAKLLDTSYINSPILAYAVSNDNAAAIEAFYALLKDLLKEPWVQLSIKDELPGLLAAINFDGTPELSDAMAQAHTGAIAAFYTGLKDLLTDPSLSLIRPTLLQALPDLLLGKTGFGDSGLAYALVNGQTAVVEIFHILLKDLLSDLDIAPYVEHALPELLAMHVMGRRASGLPYGIKAGNTATIEAFFALLMDPRITPHIQRVLPNLLTAQDMHGIPGLAHALECGYTAIIEAFHTLLRVLLRDPNGAHPIQCALPELLAAKHRDGTPGLSYARGNEHAETINAFRAMLADPIIQPHIARHLSHLWSAKKLKRDAGTLAIANRGPQLSEVD